MSEIAQYHVVRCEVRGTCVCTAVPCTIVDVFCSGQSGIKTLLLEVRSRSITIFILYILSVTDFRINYVIHY